MDVHVCMLKKYIYLLFISLLFIYYLDPLKQLFTKIGPLC